MDRQGWPHLASESQAIPGPMPSSWWQHRLRLLTFRGFQGFRQPVPKMLVQPPCAVSSKQKARCSVFVRGKCRGLCMTFLATSELIAASQPSLGQVAGWIIGKQGRHIRELQECQLLQDGSPS